MFQVVMMVTNSIIAFCNVFNLFKSCMVDDLDRKKDEDSN